MTSSQPSLIHAILDPAAPPDRLANANEYPLTTFSDPRSLSTTSQHLQSGLNRPTTTTTTTTGTAVNHSIQSQSHTNIMSEGHTRRRSSSLVGGAGYPGPSRSKSKRNGQPGGILEEDKSDSDRDDSDASSSGGTDTEAGDDGLEDDEETGLTASDRKKRTKRKRRNTRLDERVAGEFRVSKEVEDEAKRNVIQNLLINALLICLWYLFSISISLYNKWMFKTETKDGKKESVYPFPLFTTSLHMIVQFSLASLVLFLVPRFRPGHDSVDPHRSAIEPPRQEIEGPKKPLMTKWFYFSRIGPCGLATGLDIGLGNTSLIFISLTFFTMCKSSALGFVLLFAFLFRLEQPSWKLVGIIATMTVGVVLMVAGEAAFDTRGFVLVMFSAFSSGFRWSLTQILLLRNPATSNPFSSIFFLAPVMFISLLLIAIPAEGVGNAVAGLSKLMELKGDVLGILILLFPGCLAFLMTASEFALLKRTSVVTLSICGIFKEVVTISAASIVFHDKLTPINVSGLIITILSIAAYNYIKIKKMQQEARIEAHVANDQYQPVHSSEPEGDDISREPGPSNRSHALGTIPTILSERANLDNSARASPVKRPEDLE